MQELAWFAAGATAVAAALWLRAQTARRGAAPVSAPAEAAAAPPLEAPASATPAPVAAAAARANGNPERIEDARAIAKALGEELAILASGVEGRAHLLIEAAPDRRSLPIAAEGMLRAVQRLRALHRKIVAYSIDRTAVPGRAELDDVVARLADDLQQLQLGLELHWHPPATMAPIAVSPLVVGDVLMFLSAAMVRSEPGATRLSLVGEMSLGRQPRVQLELSLEWAEESGSAGMCPTAVSGRHIDFEAAASLVRAQGGSIEWTHLPGRFARTLVQLPAAAREPAPRPVVLQPQPPQPIAPPPAEPVLEPAIEHRFGGALLLEPDPTIRAMVARELKASGRAVFACADSSSARAFLETTPERFELLVVDHPRRLAPREALAQAIRDVAPNLKVFVLDGETPQDGDFALLHSIPKPFGVHELREALTLVLAARQG